MQVRSSRYLSVIAGAALALGALGCAAVESASPTPPDANPPNTNIVVGGGGTGTSGGAPDAGATPTSDASPFGMQPRAVCGDRVTQPGETCDDGNVADGDGCSSTCVSEAGFTCAAGQACVRGVACGNHLIEGQEGCDDGNTTDGDGCSAACVLDCGWECPPGAACRALKCGDGLVAGGEQCDDGNAVAGDGCSTLCQLEGKPATKAEGWACTSAKGAGTCTGPTVCKATICGNKQKEGTEQCDDGNTVTGDGCSPFCRLEPVCPPGGGACSTVCGSGLLLPGDKKACDDGNTVSGDGCSATCTIEPGFACTNVPVNPNPLVLPIVYRDFQSWQDPGGHPDFEHWIGLGQAGMVAPTLSTTNGGVPVHAAGCVPLSANGCPSDGTPAWAPTTDWFGMWYVDNPTYNKTIVQALTFAPTAAGAFQYTNESYFPLDGVAGTWGNTPGQAHNYGFTSVTRYWFEYAGAATLTFVGDDDVFVFINKKLAVELGGTHNRATGSITLDAADGTGYACDFVTPGPQAAAGTCDSVARRGGHVVNLGLAKGSVYEIAVFQAERHTVDSHYQLTLSKFSGTKSACVGACGDGVVVPPETCDLGKAKNTGAQGGCNADCTLAPYCGDKIVQPGEECDGTATCDKNCKIAIVE